MIDLISSRYCAFRAASIGFLGLAVALASIDYSQAREIDANNEVLLAIDAHAILKTGIANLATQEGSLDRDDVIALLNLSQELAAFTTAVIENASASTKDARQRNLFLAMSLVPIRSDPLGIDNPQPQDQEQYATDDTVTPRGTRSRYAYHRAIRYFRDEKYYRAISLFSTALDTATTDLERIRALAGLAATAKAQGNIQLAKDYAAQILRIEPGNKYALEIETLKRPQSTYSWRTSEYCSKLAVKCLAMTWGPDACSTAFGQYFEKEFGFGVNDVIESANCSYTINAALEEGLSNEDLQIAAMTGSLDEIGSAGLNDDSGFGSLIGVMGYAASLGVKFSVFDACMRECNWEHGDKKEKGPSSISTPVDK